MYYWKIFYKPTIIFFSPVSVIEYPKDEKPSPGQHEIQSKIGKETPSFSFGTSSREGMIFYHFESKSYLLIVDN
jgi:hypothetical protein